MDSENYISVGGTLIVVLISSLLTIFQLWPGGVKQLELLLYDWELQQLESSETDWRVVIIDIDDKSLELEGQWPWPRGKMADLLYTLKNHYGVTKTGVDIMFPEVGDVAADLSLAQAFVDTDSVASMAFSLAEDGAITRLGRLGNSVLVNRAIADQVNLPRVSSYVANNQLFPFDYLAGHVTPSFDMDGKVRRFAPVVEHQGDYFEALSVAMVRSVFDVPYIKLDSNQRSVANLGLGNYEKVTLPGLVDIPIDQDGYAWLPFNRAAGSYHYISATDILHKKIPQDELLGVFALVGSSAAGLHDLVPTPQTANMPGVEVHAHILSALLDANFTISSADEVALVMLATMILSVAVCLSVRWWGSTKSLFVMFGLMLIWLVLNRYLWGQYNVYFPLFLPLLVVLVVYAMQVGLRLYVANRDKNRVLDSLKKYAPEPVVSASLDGKEESVAPREREATVLFLDLRNFTTWAEHHSASDVNQYITWVMEKVSDVIVQYGGTIDKYIGDEVMAFWDSDKLANHATNAVLAAVEIDAYFQHFDLPESHQVIDVKYGIGINTGDVLIGQLGTNTRATYTVMGDTVNVASRLQGVSGRYDANIIIGQNTARQALAIPCRKLDDIHLKGRRQVESIYSPVIRAV